MATIFSSTTPTTFEAPTNPTTFTMRTITVVTSGTPVQFPSIVIPAGHQLTIKAATNNGPQSRRIFVADSSANTAVAANRIILRPGESIGLTVENADAVWIDSTHDGLQVEVTVEQP